MVFDPRERVRTGAALRGRRIDPYPDNANTNRGSVIDPFGAGGTGGGGGFIGGPVPAGKMQQLGAGEGLMMAISAMAANKAGGEYNNPNYKSLSFGRGDRVGPPGGTGVFAYGDPRKKKK